MEIEILLLGVQGSQFDNINFRIICFFYVKDDLNIFTESAPLGQFSHRVALSVCLSVCLSVWMSGCLRHWEQSF